MEIPGNQLTSTLLALNRRYLSLATDLWLLLPGDIVLHQRLLVSLIIRFQFRIYYVRLNDSDYHRHIILGNLLGSWRIYPAQGFQGSVAAAVLANNNVRLSSLRFDRSKQYESSYLSSFSTLLP